MTRLRAGQQLPQWPRVLAGWNASIGPTSGEVSRSETERSASQSREPSCKSPGLTMLISPCPLMAAPAPRQIKPCRICSCAGPRGEGACAKAMLRDGPTYRQPICQHETVTLREMQHAPISRPCPIGDSPRADPVSDALPCPGTGKDRRAEKGDNRRADRHGRQPESRDDRAGWFGPGQCRDVIPFRHHDRPGGNRSEKTAGHGLGICRQTDRGAKYPLQP